MQMPQILLGPTPAQPLGGLLDLSYSVLDLVRAAENTGWSVTWQTPTPCRQGRPKEQASVSR